MALYCCFERNASCSCKNDAYSSSFDQSKSLIDLFVAYPSNAWEAREAFDACEPLEYLLISDGANEYSDISDITVVASASFSRVPCSILLSKRLRFASVIR